MVTVQVLLQDSCPVGLPKVLTQGFCRLSAIGSLGFMPGPFKFQTSADGGPPTGLSRSRSSTGWLRGLRALWQCGPIRVAVNTRLLLASPRPSSSWNHI